MKHLTASLIFCIVFLCAVTIHAARLAPWTPGEMHGTDVAWVPGIGDAAKGIGRGSLNAAEEIGEAAAKNLDNLSKLPSNGIRFSDDASALIDLSRQSKRTGVTESNAATLLEWAKEYNVPFHGPEQHLNRNFKDLHIHIGPIDHIKVNE